MDDLIEALTIFRKYANPHLPTHCEHDVLLVVGVKVCEVTQEDVKRLGELGFTPGAEGYDEYDEESECYVITDETHMWTSFRFGSC